MNVRQYRRIEFDPTGHNMSNGEDVEIVKVSGSKVWVYIPSMDEVLGYVWKNGLCFKDMIDSRYRFVNTVIPLWRIKYGIFNRF